MSPKLILALLGLVALMPTVFAGDGELAANKIKPELLKNAHAVIRYDNQTIEIKNVNRQKINRKVAITILDEDGERFSPMVVFYDKFISVESIDGALYDASGKKLKSVKKSDISDVSATSSLADDQRMKYHQFYYKQYPYTVEYEVDIEKKYTIILPEWTPVGSFNKAIENSSMQVIVPQDYNLRYKAFNYNSEPQMATLKDKKSFTWELHNIAAIEEFYAAPGWRYITPVVYLAPSKFAIDDYTGDMTDWNEYGKFQLTLNAGRDQLPPNIKQKVHEIADGVKSKEEKVRLLYEYMQSNTRYISIQLGIGGLQPFEASFVAAKGYGDCKALSNYMYSILKEVGIKSYYTLVNSGADAEDIVTDFTCDQFDHVILCVPMEKDSIWLECTNQTKSAGYMGGFTGNRHVLLVTDDGGRLVPTPSYTSKENLEICNVKASLDEVGNLKINSSTIYQAIEQDDLYVHDWSDEQKLKRLKAVFDLPTYDVSSFKYEVLKAKIPAVKESLEIVASNYASVSGKRLFIIPNVLSRTHSKLIPDDNRKYDVRIVNAFTDLDTAEITIPQGYEPESVPSDVNLESKFGKYSAKVKVVGDKIIYYRRNERLNGYFPAKDYVEMTKFYSDIYKADRNKIVFVKKQA